MAASASDMPDQATAKKGKKQAPLRKEWFPPTYAQLEPEETTAEAPVQADDPTQNASSQATPDGLPSTSGHSPTTPDHTLIDEQIQKLKDQVDTAEDWDWLDTLLDPQTLPSTQHYPMPAHWIDDEAQEQ